jgi:hypothetical protein
VVLVRASKAVSLGDPLTDTLGTVRILRQHREPKIVGWDADKEYERIR